MKQKKHKMRSRRLIPQRMEQSLSDRLTNNIRNEIDRELTFKLLEAFESLRSPMAEAVVLEATQ